MSEEVSAEFVGVITDPTDSGHVPASGECIWPVAKRRAFDQEQDALMAEMLSMTELLVADFHEKNHGSQRVGQLLLDMLRHPRFDPKDMRSDNIVHLMRRLERPFQGTAMHTYNLWKEGDGNQRLELVVRDYLEVFREIMRDPQWKEHFDLVARAVFDGEGERLIGPACSALWWERIQGKLPPRAALGVSQLYFDGTFMGQNQGLQLTSESQPEGL